MLIWGASGLFIFRKLHVPVLSILYISPDQIMVDGQAILVLCGLLLMPFLKPPTRAWVGGEPLSGGSMGSFWL